MTRRASGRWRPSRVQLKTTFGAYVSLSWQSLMYMFTLLVCFFFFSRLSCLQIHSVSVVLNLQIATWATDDIQTSSEVHKCCKCVFFSYLLCSCTFTVNFLLCELCLHFTGLLNQSFDTNEFHFPCYDALMRPSYSRCIALCLSVHPSIFSRHVTHKWWSWWCVFAQSKSLERCELMTSMNLYISCRSQTLRCSMFS